MVSSSHCCDVEDEGLSIYFCQLHILSFAVNHSEKWGFPDSSFGKEPVCNGEDPGRFPGREDPLEKG